METILFTGLTALVGISTGLMIALATLSYFEKDEVFHREIRRQQDLHVSAQINQLHKTIQALQRENMTLINTRFNDTPVVRTVKTSAETKVLS